jgi:voltage-gated sodium channel
MAKKKLLSRHHLAEQSLPSGGSKNRVISLVQGIVASSAFDWIITGVILLQALALALEATPAVISVGGRSDDLLEQGTFRLIQNIVVAVFIIEAALRLIATYPRPQKYFRDSWNCFDFAIIILSVLPTTGHFSTIARLIRLLRITRLITKSTELRAIVSTLVRSIPSIFNILILLSILFFIYAIVGYHLFRDVDPEHWSSFPTSLITLFQVVTLEGWPNIMEPVVSSLGPLYWLYFTSFIVIGTFIIINLFISVIVRKSEEAYKQVQQESVIPLTKQDILHEIKEIRRILGDLEKRISEDNNKDRYASSISTWRDLM